jgi:agmatinase
MMKKANLAFTGIPTFCRTPQVASLDHIESQVAVLGIPFDEGVGYRPGTRFGPRSIREYSMRFPYFDKSSPERGYWDIEKKKRLLSNVDCVDCGDVDIVALGREYVYGQIDESIKKILKQGAFPLVLGGDHSITFPVVRAFENTGPLSIIQFDAHLDRRESMLDVQFGHGSPMRRISELEFIERIASIGLRGLRAPEEDYLFAENQGDILVPNSMVQEICVEAVLEKISITGRCFVTIDIDVLNPAVAPGTGTPEADGLSYAQLKKILWGIAKKSEIVGFDLVEVNPSLDPSGRTPLFAAQLCVEFLAAIFE